MDSSRYSIASLHEIQEIIDREGEPDLCPCGKGYLGHAFHALEKKEPWGPLPNDVVGDSIVVASIVINDDDPTIRWFLVLLLNKVPPYFTVAEIRWPNKSIDWKEDFSNIVPAVGYYKDSGGDY